MVTEAIIAFLNDYLLITKINSNLIRTVLNLANQGNIRAAKVDMVNTDI